MGGWGGNVTGQEGFRGRRVLGGPKGLQPSDTSICRRMVFRASYSDDLHITIFLTNSCLSLSLLCEIRACSVY